MGWYSPAVPVSHRGSPLLRGHLCRQADVGDGWRREKGDLNAPQLPEPLLEYLSWGNMASSCRCRWCRGSAPAGSGLGYLPNMLLCAFSLQESGVSPCRVAGASPDLSATRAAGSGQCQGSWRCHWPGAPLSHPARSQAPARGRTGRLPHPGASSRLTWFAWLGTASPERQAMPFPFHLCLRAVPELQWSQTGPGPLELPITLPRASLTLRQGAVRCSGACGCLVGTLSPQLHKGLWEDVLVPQPSQSCPASCPGHQSVQESMAAGAIGVPGEGELRQVGSMGSEHRGVQDGLLHRDPSWSLGSWRVSGCGGTWELAAAHAPRREQRLEDAVSSDGAARLLSALSAAGRW